MAEGDRRYEGGLIEQIDGERFTTPYANFVAFEYAAAPKVRLVRVCGHVDVPNPGVEALLRYGGPSRNPDFLGLELQLIQRPGTWPDVSTWAFADYVGPAEGSRVHINSRELGDQTLPIES